MGIVINIKNEIGGLDFAGSRGSGELIREKMKPVLDNGGDVTLDFTGIESITQSFADEIVGIFVRAFGIDYIKDSLRLNNANDSIKQTLNFVISYSKKKMA
ncbi:MAG: STAS-like domain-containing protein [Sulfurimonas sp.]|uniref:STAS-like domain-containing protein n=1 Tax=Sulfurimonas sp. TaxID=2022749 RepID=UPI00261ABE0C|nr:STAS-like domain-containing protein [Sulfurimonas sp.]MCW8895455.1 STAS-like domain-containing protein [Sulfurimonas sp.]MCW8953839.1 STAS-like domain-containing protein [Sulfurimonas sp.]MCW9067390.1 STAS-like domain-containing protein [Sulfurimonas sp.]